MKGVAMYRVIVLFFLCFSSLYAALIGSNFNKQDINILTELDIESSFITDYELQKSYLKYSKSSSFYKQRLNDATLFVPIIKNILRKDGVPSSFIYLAMAESNFALNAKGQSKAAGLWQFMPETGRLYGLDNNTYVDERLDLIKSSQAATKYLKRLHARLGKWYLAAMAYNAGEGRIIEGVVRATLDLYVEKNGTESRKKQVASYTQLLNDTKRKGRYRDLYDAYEDIKSWGVTPDIYTLFTTNPDAKRQYIPTETREYIRKIVALGMMNNKSFISDDDPQLLNMGNTNTTIATVKVKGGLHLQSIANAIGMSYLELSKLNLHLKEFIVPPMAKEYEIYIPYSRLSRFNLNKDTIPDEKFKLHHVKSGETLASIGKQYNVPPSVIKEYNKLTSAKLSPKQKLILPLSNEKVNETSNKVTNYYVKQGDTLRNISERYNIAMEKLMKDNNLKNSSINIGDKLVFNY